MAHASDMRQQASKAYHMKAKVSQPKYLDKVVKLGALSVNH